MNIQSLPDDVVQRIISACVQLTKPSQLTALATTCRYLQNLCAEKLSDLQASYFDVVKFLARFPYLDEFKKKQDHLRVSKLTILQQFNVSNMLRRFHDISIFAKITISKALVRLRCLDMANNEFGDEGIKTLSNAFGTGSLASLTQLYLNNNRIGDKGIKTFFLAISSGSLVTLENLNLSYNSISDEGMKAFSIAIANGSLANLKYLYLQHNLIGDAGMNDFSQAVLAPAPAPLYRSRAPPGCIDSSPKSYERWLINHSHLEMNAIDDAISSIDIKCLGNLKMLVLRDNCIGDEGIKALTSAIVKIGVMGKLETLIICDNKRISDESINDFSNVVLSLTNLRGLCIDNSWRSQALSDICSRRRVELL